MSWIRKCLVLYEKRNAKIWIKKYDRNYKSNNYYFDDDGEKVIIHVKGSVDLSGFYGESLPYSFGSVDGNFILKNGNLITLKNSPFEVQGDFILRTNKIKILLGCPEYVGKNFDISNNPLLSFSDSPKIIVGNYICSGFKTLKRIDGLNSKMGRFIHSTEKRYRLVDLEQHYDLINNVYIMSKNHSQITELINKVKVIYN